jgi:hypothetical protein
MNALRGANLAPYFGGVKEKYGVVPSEVTRSPIVAMGQEE